MALLSDGYEHGRWHGGGEESGHGWRGLKSALGRSYAGGGEGEGEGEKEKEKEKRKRRVTKKTGRTYGYGWRRGVLRVGAGGRWGSVCL